LVLDNGLVGAGMREAEGSFYRGIIIALIISMCFWFGVWWMLT
jgi:hypothetical protein